MIDDKNKDPTFTYKVPDTVYKVPDPKAHAAQMLGLQPGLGYGLTGETFIDLIESAFYCRQDLNAYADRIRAEQESRWPSPVGAPADDTEAYNSPYYSFARNFEETEQSMTSAEWVPLANSY